MTVLSRCGLGTARTCYLPDRGSSSLIPYLAPLCAEYVLLEAPLNGLFEPGAFGGDEVLLDEPHAVWPADKAWFIASDVDPDWFTIGTTRRAAEQVLTDPRFDAESVTYGTRMTIAGR